MVLNIKGSLMYCNKMLVSSGHYHFAFALFQFLQGNKSYCCSAIEAITFYSNELNKRELI